MDVFFEYRAPDAAASPYLALAAIVHAGAQGIEENLNCPVATEEDLSILTPEALTAKGYTRLPQSLAEALDKFASDDTVSGWFPKGFSAVYRKHKQGEIDYLNDKSEREVCRAYEEVY